MTRRSTQTTKNEYARDLAMFDIVRGDGNEPFVWVVTESNGCFLNEVVAVCTDLPSTIAHLDKWARDNMPIRSEEGWRRFNQQRSTAARVGFVCGVTNEAEGKDAHGYSWNRYLSIERWKVGTDTQTYPASKTRSWKSFTESEGYHKAFAKGVERGAEYVKARRAESKKRSK